MKKEQIVISVIFPLYNESGNLAKLVQRLTETLHKMKLPYEIIAVDDGSIDDSYEMLVKLEQTTPELKIVQLKYNFGQTAAISAGVECAQGGIIIAIDSDLENDPSDIPRLLAKINEGYDVVSGWRKDRWHGAFFTRRIPSVIANRLISFITGVHLHDYGCTLKAYKATVIKDIRLYGEMHRFIPAYAAWHGGKVTEISVNHTPRIYGKSNYGFGRAPRVLLDLVVLVFLHRYMNRPMHFFGSWGLFSFFLGFVAGFASILLRLFNIKHIVDTPLPILSTLFIIVGVQFILFGVIAEMLMRTYYESQGRRPYIVKYNNKN